ncbi:MAG: signal peptidase I [Cyanobacteria bacterium J06634_6]
MRSPQRLIKDCWLAVNLSGLMPGMGQCYGDMWTKGLVIFTSFFILVVHAMWSLLAADGNTVRAFWLIGIAIVVYFLNVWDAFATVGRPLYPSGNKRQGRDVWYGVFLSQILPGLGHLYLNQAAVGGLFLATGVSLAVLANYQPALLPMACTVWSVAGYHTYRSAPLVPGKNVSRSGQMLMVVVLGSLLLRLCVGSLSMWVDQAVMQCIVPSESMMPTLQVSDRIFVSKNKRYRPELGDIVVFTTPPQAVALLQADPETLFVKRVVGLPGQQVAVYEGKLWVNQEPLAESYIAAPVDYRWGPEIVPPDEYFVLGDNRNASADSHVWGFLPVNHIIGEAYKIYWPAKRVRSLRR